MSRFDEYVNSNDTPKTLCEEIERLRAEIEDLKALNNQAKLNEEDGIREAYIRG